MGGHSEQIRGRSNGQNCRAEHRCRVALAFTDQYQHTTAQQKGPSEVTPEQAPRNPE